MRICLILLAASLLCGCPRQSPPPQSGSAAAPAATAPPATPQLPEGPGGHVALVLSATQSDPWSTELLNTLGADLGTDLWSAPAAGSYFDCYGPYEIERSGGKLTLDICLCGLSGVADIAGQEALGAEARAWIEGLNPDLVWLDGDPAQFQIGSQLDPELPIVFSGVVIERRLYYDYERHITGVYERFSLPRIMTEIWESAPDAKLIGLLADDAPASAGRAQLFNSFVGALPAGHQFKIPPAAHSWRELQERIQGLADEVDAFIFCGVGEEGCNPDFISNGAPADLLNGIQQPVVVLGPSRMDYCGAPSLRLKPSVHARTALELVDKVLSGIDPLTIPSITPDEMAVFLAENDAKPAVQTSPGDPR